MPIGDYELDGAAAVGQLFLVLRRPLHHYVLRIVNDVAEAEDLTQESFLRLYGELCKGTRIENVRGWVFQVAHNLAIDRQRRISLLEQLDAVHWEQKAHPGPTLEQHLIRKRRQERMASALARLSPRERRCLQLRAEGFRYREIAERLGIRITSVENYCSRAVKKISHGLAPS